MIDVEAVNYRTYQESDAETCVDIMRQAVFEIALRYYTPEQIAAWADRLPDSATLNARYTDGRFALIAVTAENEPLAFGDVMANGHVDLLYCRPQFSGQGIVSRLYDRLEVEARRQSLDVLTVDASEAAKLLFDRKGFAVIRRNDMEINGVTIHNYRMEKQLV